MLGALLLAACAGGPEADGPAERTVPEPPATMEPDLELTLETDREVYAPGDPVTLVLTLTNRGNEPVTLEFSDAQRYDFRILDAGGEAVWRWSEGYAFAQMLGQERLASGEAREWLERYEGPIPPGEYTARGTVPATDRRLQAETSFRVRPDTR